ncbi:conserved protein of unknown function [Georgfuchsia toluolica]|uniref:DUF1015 domain-containing protein n=2 Tax=Georgfuchsia toluolica TaxID=424218 RepID=A0A916J471_9PROT|nr:conserved protein of unknown function [Georgfuchsia toluolica]
MPLIKPFRGLRPAPGRAGDVAAPPYDVLSTAEARVRANGKPWSFLHISKPEIDLPANTDPYAPEVYAKAASNLKAMLDQGILQRDDKDCYYAYRLTMGSHVQTGLVAAAAVADYDSNRIRKHELTRPDKEDDRVRQIEALGAQTGPVLLAYPNSHAADALIATASGGQPDADAIAADGIRHQIWVVRDTALIGQISRIFDAMPTLYIADGHHRSAAASRVAAARRGNAAAQHFLAVIFPHHEMKIMDYNRVVKDLNGMSETDFLARSSERFAIEPSASAVHPAQPGVFGLYLPGRWFTLTVKPELIPHADPVARLDVSLLSDNLLGPVLNITDLRRDKRIDFVGGIRGLRELEQRVDSGEMAAAFALHPTRMTELMAVADAGEIMPPKSTWFEPKLADGLVSHVLD